MSCHTKPGPAAFCSFIEDVYQEKVTQADWHAIRELAAADKGGSKLSRARVNSEQVSDSALGLADKAAQENGITVADEDSWAGVQFDQCVEEMQESLTRVGNTQGTLDVIDYLAKHGVLDTLARVRDGGDADAEGSQGSGSPRSEQVLNSGTNDTVCVCGNTVDDSGFYAYSAGREVEPDENWDGDSMFCAACARVFSQSTGDVIDRPARITTLDNFEVVAVYEGDGNPPEPPTSGVRII